MAGAAASSAGLPAVPDPGTVDERPPPARVHKSLGHRIRGRMPGFAGGVLVAFVMLVLFGPVLMLALFSFNDSSIISLPWEGFTTKWYEEAWANGQARDAVTNSLIVASIVMVLSVVLGTMAAWGLTRLRFRGRGAVAGLNGAVLVVPWLIIGVAGLIFFSQIQVQLSLQTITLMHLVVTFPLVVAIVSAGLVRFQRSLEEAAHRPRRQPASDAPLRRPAPDRTVDRGGVDLRLRLVVQQLRDLLLHRRLRADVPRLGLLDPAPVGEPADRQCRLDGDRGRSDPRRHGCVGADEAALQE